MKCRLFNLLAGLSLLLCLATVTLWVRSYWTTDFVERNVCWNIKPPRVGGVVQTGQWQGIGVAIGSYPSRLCLAISYRRCNLDISGRPMDYAPYIRLKLRRLGWTHYPAAAVAYPGSYPAVPIWQGVFFDQATGFAINGFIDFHKVDFVDNYYGVFDWLIVLATAILPAVYAIKAILRRRKPRNPYACLTCGYDLRATPNRCPECGSAPQQKQAAGSGATLYISS